MASQKSGISKIIDRKQVLVNRKSVELFQYAKDEMKRVLEL
jgi:hypothetical protein